MILFVTGTGTGVGKTAVTVGLTQLFVSIGVSVVAVKPIETGCAPEAHDANALAAACRRPDLSRHPGFYRASRPLSPYAATLAGEPLADFETVVGTCRTLAVDADPLLVEGAGGLLVPIDATRTMADIAVALGSKLLLVAPDRLGVLSDVFATLECAAHRGLTVLAVVLNRGVGPADSARDHNAFILRERCAAPVVTLEAISPDHPLDAIRGSGLLEALGLAR